MDFWVTTMHTAGSYFKNAFSLIRNYQSGCNILPPLPQKRLKIRVKKKKKRSELEIKTWMCCCREWKGLMWQSKSCRFCEVLCVVLATVCGPLSTVECGSYLKKNK